tara:strand:+ start:5124 stop:5561 length:438 start_codon:yes stop_codon:yes gene_type:complete
MKTSFADYCATQDARNTLQLKVREWTLMLCDALEHNYIEEAIRRQNFFAANDSSDFSNKRIEEIKNGDHYKFTIEEGRKYLKIMQIDTSDGRAVHAFVDKKTGELYKAASYKAPAKGARFDLRLIQQREWVLENCDWAGGYLYKN